MISTNNEKVNALDRYVMEINRYPILTRKQENELAKQYVKDRDLEAAHCLVNSNLRFVVKISHEYRGYGFKLLDLIQEGNIGLMLAVKKFDPSKGYRLISYAVWWIRAYIQNFIIHSWSLIKVGTTQAQRKLFFKLRSEKEQVERELPQGDVSSNKILAKRLDVLEGDVIDMEMRLSSRDFSLDAELEEDNKNTYLELLQDERANQEEILTQKEQGCFVLDKVHQAMSHLNDRERFIIEQRLMSEEPKTLQEIGDHFQISRERARQIEGTVLRKIKVHFKGTDVEPLAA